MPKKMGSARLNVGVRFVVLILTVLVAGCAAQTSEQVLKPPDIDLSKRSRAVVVIDHAGSAMPQEADLLATDLSAKLNETGRFSQVDVQTPQPATADYLLVKCSISAIKRVSREERLLIGAIAGRASLDVHVTVVQQPSGKVVGEAQVGGTSSGGNIFAGTTDDAINKTAEAISNFVTSQGST
ncbi:MAG TPA: DUF4410 domain-containing protein [Candidatus Binataceae bacterium]|nr:DUF4410 domain-containing protein [Candidatus Binataceae bacterium]